MVEDAIASEEADIEEEEGGELVDEQGEPVNLYSALVLLDEKQWKAKELPSAEDLTEFLKKNYPDCPVPADFRDGEDGSILFVLEDEQVSIGFLEQSFDDEDLEYYSARSWWWSDIDEKLAQHKGSIDISISASRFDGVSCSLFLSCLVSAILELNKGFAVYWALSDAIREAQDFRDTLKSCLTEDPPYPLPLWLDLQCGSDEEDQTLFYSIGMEALGYHEVEVHGSSLEPEKLFEVIIPLLLYIVDEDVVFEEGDTFGFEEDEQLEVGYKASLVDEEREVLVVNLP